MGSRSSKEGCAGGRFMTQTAIENTNVDADLNMEIILSEDDKSVYVKLTGFETLEDANLYADYLTNNLPLLLFQSEVLH